MFRKVVSKEQRGHTMHIEYNDGTVDYDIIDMGNEYYMKGKEAFISRFGFDLNPDEIEVSGTALANLCYYAKYQ